MRVVSLLTTAGMLMKPGRLPESHSRQKCQKFIDITCREGFNSGLLLEQRQIVSLLSNSHIEILEECKGEIFSAISCQSPIMEALILFCNS